MVKITFFHPTGDEGRQYASEPSQFFEYIQSKLFYTISPTVGSFLLTHKFLFVLFVTEEISYSIMVVSDCYAKPHATGVPNS